MEFEFFNFSKVLCYCVLLKFCIVYILYLYLYLCKCEYVVLSVLWLMNILYVIMVFVLWVM